MEILLTGNTAFLTKEWVDTAFPDDHVLITHTRGEAALDRSLKAVELDSRQRLSELSTTYQFDRVVYFSAYLQPHGVQEGELDRLRWVLQECRDREVQLLYFSGPESSLTPASGKALLARTAEELCFQYARTGKIQVKVFRLPYLYALTPGGTAAFDPLFRQMKSGKVVFEEQTGQPLLALCADELADLTARVFDVWTPQPETFLLPAVSPLTQGDFGAALQKLQPGLSVEYGTDTIQAYPPDDQAVRHQYGWQPRSSLLDDLPELYRIWAGQQAPKKPLLRRLFDKLRQSATLLRLVEILAAWAVSEFLVRATNTDAQFQMVDFRLMYVMLIGTMYGLNSGVLAALLASVSLAAGYLRQGATLMLLFYEPSNWLAFIAYFVVGAACGYIQLRNLEAVRFVKDENDLLRRRLDFTEQLYRDTLKDKQLFRRQILGRRDSFGKIYTVTQQLNTLQPQDIYRKTVQVMEDILQNHSLFIYRLEPSHGFARLTAASAALEPQLEHSLDVQQRLDLVRASEQDGLWVNREFKPDRPMYAAGVRQNGALVVIIGLQTAADDQMTLYFQNLFRILCGLVETALVRAFEYESAVQESHYLPGTNLLRPEYFAEQLSAACALQEEKMSHHLLLRVTGKFRNQDEMNAQLSRSIRSSDVAGIGADRCVYLLLNQATEENLALLTRRMKAKGFSVTSVPLDEQLRLVSAAKRGDANA